MEESNQEIGIKLARDYFTPAFQDAMQRASNDKYQPMDILNGIINAYLIMLKSVFQSDQVVSGMLVAQAEYIKQYSKSSLH